MICKENILNIWHHNSKILTKIKAITENNSSITDVKRLAIETVTVGAIVPGSGAEADEMAFALQVAYHAETMFKLWNASNGVRMASGNGSGWWAIWDYQTTPIMYHWKTYLYWWSPEILTKTFTPIFKQKNRITKGAGTLMGDWWEVSINWN
jgi:hypothetical protein